MPMKPIERLLFSQGGLCFFCDKPLATDHATVEHLVATANGGSNGDYNCVACCKSLNQLLGSKSLKEKLRVVLVQKREFTCPNGAQTKTGQPKLTKSPSVTLLNDKYSQLVKNLKHSKARPHKVPKLKNTIRTIFQRPKISLDEVEALFQKLQSTGAISITGVRITYNSF